MALLTSSACVSYPSGPSTQCIAARPAKEQRPVHPRLSPHERHCIDLWRGQGVVCHRLGLCHVDGEEVKAHRLQNEECIELVQSGLRFLPAIKSANQALKSAQLDRRCLCVAAPQEWPHIRPETRQNAWRCHYSISLDWCTEPEACFECHA